MSIILDIVSCFYSVSNVFWTGPVIIKYMVPIIKSPSSQYLIVLYTNKQKYTKG